MQNRDRTVFVDVWLLFEVRSHNFIFALFLLNIRIDSAEKATVRLFICVLRLQRHVQELKSLTWSKVFAREFCATKVATLNRCWGHVECLCLKAAHRKIRTKKKQLLFKQWTAKTHVFFCFWRVVIVVFSVFVLFICLWLPCGNLFLHVLWEM